MAAELPEPFGSPPGRPAKYVFYLSRHGDDDTQVMVVTFGAPYAARKFLDVLLKGDGIVWDDDCTIRSETGIVVSTRWYPKRMKACVEHEYSLAEMAWDLKDVSPQTYKWARQFRNGPDLPRTLEEDKQAVHHREKRERKSGVAKTAHPAGYVHVSDIALSMNVEPKSCRVALRKIYGDNKPAYGWYFDPKEVDAVKAKIKAAIK